MKKSVSLEYHLRVRLGNRMGFTGLWSAVEVFGQKSEPNAEFGGIAQRLKHYPGNPGEYCAIGEIMGKDERAGSLNLTFLAMLLSLLSTVSCTPLLIGQAAYEGTIVTAAAASSTSEDRDNSLKGSVKTFNDAFRSEDYAQAAVFVSPDKKEHFWSEVDRFQGKIRLAEFELRNTQLDEKKHQATAILNFQYWRPESPTLETISCTQKWQYSEKDKRWRVSDIGFEAIPSSSY